MNDRLRDLALDTLLEPDGQVFFVDEKQTYWVNFRAKRIEPTEEKPHGIDYALALHDPTGRRLTGYDNAHPVAATKGPGGRKAGSRDHKHRLDNVRPYEFTDAGTLMEDFWNDVDKLLEEKGVWT